MVNVRILRNFAVVAVLASVSYGTADQTSQLELDQPEFEEYLDGWENEETERPLCNEDTDLYHTYFDGEKALKLTFRSIPDGDIHDLCATRHCLQIITSQRVLNAELRKSESNTKVDTLNTLIRTHSNFTGSVLPTKPLAQSSGKSRSFHGKGLDLELDNALEIRCEPSDKPGHHNLVLTYAAQE